MPAEIDYDRPDFKGLSKEEIATIEHEQEKEALKEYGVFLNDDHMLGYMYRPDRFYHDITSVQKPWETNLVHSLGPDHVIKCATPESWDNDAVLFELNEGIAYVTLNQPDNNNALNAEIAAGLHDAWLILKNRPDIRICVITGTGRMFCAGGDPKVFQSEVMEQFGGEEVEGAPAGHKIIGELERLDQGSKAHTEAFVRDLITLSELPQFVILCMNGSAMGGGVGLMACCDHVVAVKTAHCTLSEVKLGVIPAAISPHVVRTIGPSNAKRLFCTAENCNMYKAMEYGIVQRIVNGVTEFPMVVKELAQKVNACAPGAVAAAKKSILNVVDQPLSESLMNYTAKEYTRIRKTKECEEGMKALMAKKKPTWVENRIVVRT